MARSSSSPPPSRFLIARIEVAVAVAHAHSKQREIEKRRGRDLSGTGRRVGWQSEERDVRAFGRWREKFYGSGSPNMVTWPRLTSREAVDPRTQAAEYIDTVLGK